jgi:putative glutamate/gamma-aminobutyrate antiporter
MKKKLKLPARSLSVFMLAMINIAAIGSVKNWPLTAEYGFASIFYFLLGACVFFLPLALVTAELATSIPKSGGVFAWVKEAFGHRTGFLAVWLQWVENVIWYPTVLSFIAAALAYAFDPELVDNTVYTTIAILIIFWSATCDNLFGMKTSGWISAISVILGTFIPAGLFIALGVFWYSAGNPLEITMSWDSFIPSVSSVDDIVFFCGVMLSLCGMEMSAVHVQDVKNPKRDFPRAILLSGVILVVLSIFGVLSIASLVPREEINLVSGSLQAFGYFLDAYGTSWLTPVIAFLIAIGAFGGMSTWIVGPSKGLLAAAQNGDLPPYFRAINARGIPVRLLVTQALIVTGLSLLFLLMPSLSSAFWILTAMIVQVYLIMYILMFAAAIKLRYKNPQLPRPYKIPGGKVGMWIVSGVGIASSIFAIFIGFFPPSQIPTGNLYLYVFFLALCIVLSCIAPAIILRFQKASWKKPLAHEQSDQIFY